MFSVSNPISSIHCQRTDNCSYYTYFLEADPYSQLCILLSSLIEPLQPCDSCVTGPEDCDDRDECSLNVDDERVDHKMFTAGVNITLNIHLVFSSCQLKILLVGGGGRAGSGGGGSGYIHYYQTTVEHDTWISVTVGDSGQPSLVTLEDTVLEASPGDDYESGTNNGAAGYSGGGAWCGRSDGCDGGTDGGAGEDGAVYHGGTGAGDIVSEYSSDHYQLRAGAGGVRWLTDSQFYLGGGGGGVLVNGEGPGGATQHHGQGYGGGGCSQVIEGSWSQTGLPGVVLIEIGPAD